jgi:hypothetical protein
MQFGCDPKISTVLKKYEAPYREKREQLKKIANSLPPKGSLGNSLPCKEINPAIGFDEKAKDFNAEILMFEQLIDPDTNPDWDLLLSGELLNSIQWTGPKNPLSESALGNNGESMEKTLSSALKYRYLVVNRVQAITPPVVKDKDNHTQGKVIVETFIIDLTDSKTICGFTTSATSLENLSNIPLNTKTTVQRKTTGGGRYGGKVRNEETKTTPIPISVQLQNAADSSLWEASRSQIIGKLKELTKAKIELEN